MKSEIRKLRPETFREPSINLHISLSFHKQIN